MTLLRFVDPPTSPPNPLDVDGTPCVLPLLARQGRRVRDMSLHKLRRKYAPDAICAFKDEKTRGEIYPVTLDAISRAGLSARLPRFPRKRFEKRSAE